MELDKVIKDRRSIRKYKNKHINRDVLNNILNNAILSTSAHNNQPWSYYVFTLDKKIELEYLIGDYITKKL